MINCHIDFDGFKKKRKKKEKESETNVQPSKAATIEGLRTRVQTTDRGFFPDDFPTFEKIETEIKSMLANGKTQVDVDTKFKAPYRFISCYLCRVLPGKDYLHIAKTCQILKQMLPSYSTSTLDSSIATISNDDQNIFGNTLRTKSKYPPTKWKKKVPTSSALPIKMCYDSGTTPKSLCSKKELFRDLVLFDKPKFFTLADPDSTSQVLGQDTLDIIINNKYRIWIFTYFTAASDALLFAVNHLSYKNCKISGENGKIKIHYSTFNFDVLRSEHFEYNILPGKRSKNKPVLCQPSRADRVNEMTHDDLVKIQRINNDSTLPQRATHRASGYDISSSTMLAVPSNSTVTTPLRSAMSYPDHLQCSIQPRSSLSLRGINVALGTIERQS